MLKQSPVVTCGTVPGSPLLVTINSVRVYVACAPANIWTLVSLDLSAWAGQDVDVKFEAISYSAPYSSVYYYLDDISFKESCCTSSEDCDDGEPCTNDLCGPLFECSYAAVDNCCSAKPFMNLNFDPGSPAGWSMSGNFSAISSGFNGTNAVRASVSSGSLSSGELKLPSVHIPVTGAKLSFQLQQSASHVCGTASGVHLGVTVNGTVVHVACNVTLNTWELVEVDVSAWAGTDVAIRFYVVTPTAPSSSAWYFLDDIALYGNCGG